MPNFVKPNRWSEIFVSGALLLLACNFALNFARDGQYFLSIEKFTDLDVALPYQYRILMVPVFQMLIPFFKTANLQTLFTHVPTYLATPEALAYFTVNTVSFFIAVQTFRRIAFDILHSTKLTACAVFLFIVLTYVTFVLNPNLNFILPYDLPSLAFIQLGTLCIIRERWKTVIVLFAFATVNRETTFLLIFFLVLRWWFHQYKERNSALITAAVLSFFWAAIKLALSLSIAGNGSEDLSIGGIAAWRLGYNLTEFLKPWQWPSLLPNFLPFGILIMLLTGRIKSDQEWHMTALAGYAALFLVANVTEFRAFADLIGFFTMSLTLILRNYNIFVTSEIERRTTATRRARIKKTHG